MVKAFISHVGEDRGQAETVRQWLGQDHQVFLAHHPRDGIAGREQWRLELSKRLRWADAVVCILTREYRILVVDQFEELLTQSSRDARAQFTTLLNSTLGSPVHVVATLRPEFLDQLLGDTKLSPIRLYPPRPLHRAALREAIEKPAGVSRHRRGRGPGGSVDHRHRHRWVHQP